MVYPIAVDRDTGRIAGAGETLKEKHERGLVSRAEYDS